jgi:hypothetical protein
MYGSRVGIAFSLVAATGLEMTDLAVAQAPMDNSTNATMMAQGNMTTSAGNMTDANMTQIGQYVGLRQRIFLRSDNKDLE